MNSKYIIYDLEPHLISSVAPIREALKKLNTIPERMTLFITDEAGKCVGSLTDGDIRRGFIDGKGFDNIVKDFIGSNFHSAHPQNININEIKMMRKKGIKLLPVINRNGEIEKIYNIRNLQSILPVDVVIMAGGKGARLKPLTDSIPKPLLKLGDKPIIDYVIDHLIEFGIENIHISVNYLADQIQDYLGDGSSRGLKINYLKESQPLGTIGSVSLIDDLQQDLLVLNADLFTNIDYEDLYLYFIQEQADMAIASVPYSVNIPYAVLKEQEKRVIDFAEKPDSTNYVNAGIYLIKKEHAQKIPKEKKFDATDFINLLLKEQKKVIHNPIIGYWTDIGNHEELKKAMEIVNHIR